LSIPDTHPKSVRKGPWSVRWGASFQRRRSDLDIRQERQEHDLQSFGSSQQWRESVSITRLQASAMKLYWLNVLGNSWQGSRVPGCTPPLARLLFLHTSQRTLLTRSMIRGACQSELEPILRTLSRNQFQPAGLCKHVAACDESEPCRRLSYVQAAPLDPFVLASACTAINTLPTLRCTV
jgi:hypothetical protein